MKRGRLWDIWKLLKSLRYHQQAVAVVVGDVEAQRLGTFAGKMIEVLERHPASLDRRLVVNKGTVLLAGVGGEEHP